MPLTMSVRRRLLITFALALGSCATPPPAAATAEVSVLLDVQAEAIKRARENTAANLRAFAERVKDENAARIEARFVERLGTESRPVADVIAEVAARDRALKSSAEEVDAALRKALADANFEAAAEANLAAQEYVDEITERQRAEARLRKLIGLKETTP